MYKLMIVDDEFITRDGLKTVVPWHSIHVTVVGEASDGLEGLEKIPELQPDIIISDVKMDNMDGLTMVEEIARLYPRIKIIILSGYDFPEHIRKSLELNVFAYLLKPITGKELLNTTSQLICEIEKENQLMKKIEMIETELTANHGFFVNLFINDLIHGNIPPGEAFRQKLEILGIRFEKAIYTCGIFYVASFHDIIRESGFQELQEIFMRLAQILRDTTPYEIWPVYHFRENLAVVFGSNSPADSKGVLNPESVLRTIHKYARVPITGAFGNSYANIRDIWKSYQQASLAFENSIINDVPGLIEFNDNPVEDGFLYPVDSEKRLMGIFIHGNDEEIRAAIGDLFDALEEQGCSRQRMLAEIMGLIGVFSRKTMDMGVDLFRLYEKDVLNPFRAFERYGERLQLENWLLNIVRNAKNLIWKERKQQNTALIERAVHFIEGNYPKYDMSLQAVSDYIGVNASYLSRIFKKETGSSFIDFLTVLRIEKSKELLKQTHLKINEIADKTGYQSSKYFCTIFKKIVGCSPLEYRNTKEDRLE